MKFTKYHALGNDYIVVDPKYLSHELSVAEIKTMCDRHYGMGSDGVLYGPLKSEFADFKLRIFNPDGSEAEKSGNGLRIFSRYLHDCGLVTNNQFSIETKGGKIQATVFKTASLVAVEMGRVNFTHGAEVALIPNSETIAVEGQRFEYYRVNVGNPHCVIPVKSLSPQLAHQYGSAIEKDHRFAQRTNVQFMQVIDRNTIQIEIWERGAGYTLASGSSSTASAALAHGLGLCDADISVHMPGGIIDISLDKEFSATMKGAVCRIGDGHLSTEALKQQKP